MNRKKNEKVKEQLDYVLRQQPQERRGRPFSKTRFPSEDIEAIVDFLKEKGGEGYMRLAAMARDTKLRKNNPRLYADLQQWLYEAGYGKHKTRVESEVNLPVKIVFEVVKTPQEITKPSLIVEGQVKELTEGEAESYESTRSQASVIADADGTD